MEMEGGAMAGLTADRYDCVSCCDDLHMCYICIHIYILHKDIRICRYCMYLLNIETTRRVRVIRVSLPLQRKKASWQVIYIRMTPSLNNAHSHASRHHNAYQEGISSTST